MRKRTFIILAVCLALGAIALGAAAPQAQARTKRWVKVITLRGATEQYTGQYDSRVFKLKGGNQKLVGSVVPDPDLAANDMADWWMASWSVEQASPGWHSAYMTMDPSEGAGTSMTAQVKLPKGRYQLNPNAANCSWTVVIWEKR